MEENIKSPNSGPVLVISDAILDTSFYVIGLQFPSHNNDNALDYFKYIFQVLWYIQFSFFPVYMFYKTTVNNKLANAKSLLQWGKVLGYWEPLITVFFVNLSIHSLVLCAFLFKGAIFNRLHCFTSIKVLANIQKLMSQQSLSNTHFPPKAHHSLLALKSNRQQFSIMLGHHLKQQNRQQ